MATDLFQLAGIAPPQPAEGPDLFQSSGGVDLFQLAGVVPTTLGAAAAQPGMGFTPGRSFSLGMEMGWQGAVESRYRGLSQQSDALQSRMVPLPETKPLGMPEGEWQAELEGRAIQEVELSELQSGMTRAKDVSASIAKRIEQMGAPYDPVFAKAMMDIVDSDAGWWDQVKQSVSLFADNPDQVGNIVFQSLGMLAGDPATAIGQVYSSVGKRGPAAAVQLGTAFRMEYNMALQEHAKDPLNPTEEEQDFAFKRAVPIALAEAAGTFIAGGGPGAIRRTLQVAAGPVAGSAGELGAQTWSGQEQNIPEIVLEGIAELPTAVLEVGGHGLRDAVVRAGKPDPALSDEELLAAIGLAEQPDQALVTDAINRGLLDANGQPVQGGQAANIPDTQLPPAPGQQPNLPPIQAPESNLTRPQPRTLGEAANQFPDASVEQQRELQRLARTDAELAARLEEQDRARAEVERINQMPVDVRRAYLRQMGVNTAEDVSIPAGPSTQATPQGTVPNAPQAAPAAVPGPSQAQGAGNVTIEQVVEAVQRRVPGAKIVVASTGERGLEVDDLGYYDENTGEIIINRDYGSPVDAAETLAEEIFHESFEPMVGRQQYERDMGHVAKAHKSDIESFIAGFSNNPAYQARLRANKFLAAEEFMIDLVRREAAGELLRPRQKSAIRDFLRRLQRALNRFTGRRWSKAEMVDLIASRYEARRQGAPQRGQGGQRKLRRDGRGGGYDRGESERQALQAQIDKATGGRRHGMVFDFKDGGEQLRRDTEFMKRAKGQRGPVTRKDMADRVRHDSNYTEVLNRTEERHGAPAAQRVRDAARKIVDIGIERGVSGRIKFRRAPALDSKEFKQWFRNSKVVDEDGNPKVVYHGTTWDISIFKRAHLQNFLGSAFYFSDNPSDASENYAGRGPDLDTRIYDRAQEIVADLENGEVDGYRLQDGDPDAARINAELERIEDGDDDVDIEALGEELADRELNGRQPNVMPVYLSIQNPAVIGGNNPTVLEWNQEYDEEADEYGEPTGSLVGFIEAVRELEGDFEVAGSLDRFIEKVQEWSIDDGGVTVEDAFRAFRDSYPEVYLNGEMADQEFFRRALEEAGFDGIIDHGAGRRWGDMGGMTDDTTHYLAFGRTQVKSATGNVGSYGQRPVTSEEAGRLGMTEDDANWAQDRGDIKFRRHGGRNPQVDTPAFKKWFGRSIVVDDDGNPRVVYRGEHGRTDETMVGRHTRHGALTYSDVPSAANTYAMDPNDRRKDPVAEAPRVTAAYVRIENPVINSPDDPFIEMTDLVKAVGEKRARAIVKDQEMNLRGGDTWWDWVGKYGDEYGTLDLDKVPVSELSLPAFPVFDNPRYVEWFKAAGYDGVVHGGMGENAGDIEYRPFSDNQVKSAIGNVGTFSNDTGDIKFRKADLTQPAPARNPSLGKKQVVGNVKPHLLQQSLDRLDLAQRLNPQPLSDEESWLQYMADVAVDNDGEVPVAPTEAIRLYNDLPRLVAEVERVNDTQVRDANHGLGLTQRVGGLYLSGKADPKFTAKLFMWSYMSKSASAYPHEAGFLELLYGGVDEFLELAAQGRFDAAANRRYQSFVSRLNLKDRSAAASVTSNMNDFGKTFLQKMGRPNHAGVIPIVELHNMIKNPEISSREIRRRFYGLVEKPGIDNKVLSFTLLMAGRHDVVVIDRIQARHFWNDPRYSHIDNLYEGDKEDNPEYIRLKNLGHNDTQDLRRGLSKNRDGTTYREAGDGLDLFPGRNKKGKVLSKGEMKETYPDVPIKLVRNPGLAGVITGVRGLSIYEAIEDHLGPMVLEAYKQAGRSEVGTVGRYHWESWVAMSTQEVDHATIEALTREYEEDISVSEAFEGVSSREGRYHQTNFGHEYSPANGGTYRVPTSDGKHYLLTPAQYRVLQRKTNNYLQRKAVKDAGFPGVEKAAKELEAPWYNHPAVDRTVIDNLVRENGTEETVRTGRRQVGVEAPSVPVDRPRGGDDRQRAQTPRQRRNARAAGPGRKNRKVTTEKGSVIQRDPRYGVGKRMGAELYVHRDYVPAELQAQVDKAAGKVDHAYNAVRINTKTGEVMFAESPDFDTSPEPIVGKYTVVRPNGTTRTASTSNIWHHKWLWVGDDYQGFDVDESFTRSEKWTSQMDGRSTAGIGSKAKWESDFVPSFKFRRIGNEAAQGRGSAGTSLKQVAAGIKKVVAAGKIKPGAKVLDLGGGKYDLGVDYIQSKVKGSEARVIDPYNREQDHNDQVNAWIEENDGVDVVFSNNVLNVIDTIEAQREVVDNARRALKKGGTAYFTVYEGDKSGQGRATQKDQSWQQHKATAEYLPLIASVFGSKNVTRRGQVIEAVNREDVKYRKQYHSSPHIWEGEDKFVKGRPRLDKIGTGEGATVYGWGFYTADAFGVAKWYWNKFARRQSKYIEIDGNRIDDDLIPRMYRDALEDFIDRHKGDAAGIAADYRARYDKDEQSMQFMVDDYNAAAKYTFDQWKGVVGRPDGPESGWPAGMFAAVNSNHSYQFAAELSSLFAQTDRRSGNVLRETFSHYRQEMYEKAARIQAELDNHRQSHELILKRLEEGSRAGVGSEGTTTFYEVHLPDDVDHLYLNWEKSLENQTPEVREAIGKLPAVIRDELGLSSKEPHYEHPGGFGHWSELFEKNPNDMTPKELAAAKRVLARVDGRFIEYGEWMMRRYTGHTLYEDIANKLGGMSDRKAQRRASMMLDKAGIPGLRYYDADSRYSGKEEYNHVTWNQGVLDRATVERYKSPGGAKFRRAQPGDVRRSRGEWRDSAAARGANWVAAAPHALVRRHGEASPTAKRIADSFWSDNGKDIVTRADKKAAEFARRYHEAVKPLLGRTGTLSMKDSEGLYDMLLYGRGPRKYIAPAQAVRQIFTDVHTYMTQAGMDIGYIKNYIPRVYDTAYLMTGKGARAFKAALAQGGITGANANQVLNEILDAQGHLDFGFTKSTDPKDFVDKQGFEKARGLIGDRWDELLKPFVSRDLQALMGTHLRAATARAEFSRLYGQRGAALGELVENAKKELESANRRITDGERWDVDQFVRDVKTLVDLQQGTYAPEVFGKKGRQVGSRPVGKAIAQAEIIMKLPLVALASMPEFFTPLLRGGNVFDWTAGVISAAMQAVSGATNAVTRAAFKKSLAPNTAAYEALLDDGVIEFTSLQTLGHRFAPPAFRGRVLGRLERGRIMDVTAHAFMKATMLEQLTNLQRVVAWTIHKRVTDRLRKRAAKGSLGEIDQRFMDRYGDPQLGGIKFVKEVITDPNPMTTPLAFNHPIMTHVLMFKRFLSVFNNTLLKTTVKEIGAPKMTSKVRNGLRFLAAGALMYAAAYYANILRNILKYGDEDNPYDDEDETFWNTMSILGRTGLLGPVETWALPLIRPRYGYWETSKDRLFNMAGPAAGDLAAVIDVGQYLAEGKSDQAAKILARMVPVANVIPDARKQVAEQIEDIIDW